jgi:hypothetical protein
MVNFTPARGAIIVFCVLVVLHLSTLYFHAISSAALPAPVQPVTVGSVIAAANGNISALTELISQNVSVPTSPGGGPRTKRRPVLRVPHKSMMIPSAAFRGEATVGRRETLPAPRTSDRVSQFPMPLLHTVVSLACAHSRISRLPLLLDRLQPLCRFEEGCLLVVSVRPSRDGVRRMGRHGPTNERLSRDTLTLGDDGFTDSLRWIDRPQYDHVVFRDLFVDYGTISKLVGGLEYLLQCAGGGSGDDRSSKGKGKGKSKGQYWRLSARHARTWARYNEKLDSRDNRACPSSDTVTAVAADAVIVAVDEDDAFSPGMISGLADCARDAYGHTAAAVENAWLRDYQEASRRARELSPLSGGAGRGDRQDLGLILRELPVGNYPPPEGDSTKIDAGLLSGTKKSSIGGLVCYQRQREWVGFAFAAPSSAYAMRLKSGMNILFLEVVREPFSRNNKWVPSDFLKKDSCYMHGDMWLGAMLAHHGVWPSSDPNPNITSAAPSSPESYVRLGGMSEADVVGPDHALAELMCWFRIARDVVELRSEPGTPSLEYASAVGGRHLTTRNLVVSTMATVQLALIRRVQDRHGLVFAYLKDSFGVGAVDVIRNSLLVRTEWEPQSLAAAHQREKQEQQLSNGIKPPRLHALSGVDIEAALLAMDAAEKEEADAEEMAVEREGEAEEEEEVEEE